MKIITVNIPLAHVEQINKLIGDNGLYPSRSELIRVAIREFLIREIREAKQPKTKNTNSIKSEIESTNPFDSKNFVRVTQTSLNGQVMEKVYKIVHKEGRE